MPSTFRPVNARALLPAGIERNAKIVRVQCLDDFAAEIPDFGKLRDAVERPVRDATVVDPVIRLLNKAHSGERPEYAAFKSEVAAELLKPRWLDALIARLGLGHFAVVAGQTRYFALMEYTIDEVFQQAGVPQPFAVPTVLEAPNSAFFHSAPFGCGAGYAADLDPAAGRDAVREILHIRLTYRGQHMIKVAALVGPTPAVRVGMVRDAHLTKIRARCSRPDFGVLMADGVDE